MKKKTPEEIKEEKVIDSYQKRGFLEKVPYWAKAIFIKYWFFGAICFFVLMGLGTVISGGFDKVAICGLLGGMITDVVTDNLLLMLDSSDNESQWFVIYKKQKSVLSLVINIVYTFLLFWGCAYIWTMIVNSYGETTIWLLQEPLSQALFLIIVDMACIGIKDLILYELIKHNCIKPKDKNKK